MVSEDTFKNWGNGPGKTETEKSENAENSVQKAIAADERLGSMDISVFPQGSYRARTNVKQNSDVDICVRLNSTFFPDYPQGKTGRDFGNSDGSISYVDFKNYVGSALANYFPAGTVSRGEKAFDVHANTYRIDADVVATLELRRYTGQLNANGSHHYHSGVAFIPDGKTTRIENWPEQAYENGRTKHDNTGRRYKKMVRILKRLRDKMQDEQISAAEDVSSFLIESLVWNVPNEAFDHETYKQDVREVLAAAFNATITDDACKSWVEVSHMKWLFRPSQPWTRQKAHDFLSAAWNYLELT